MTKTKDLIKEIDRQDLQMKIDKCNATIIKMVELREKYKKKLRRRGRK